MHDFSWKWYLRIDFLSPLSNFLKNSVLSLRHYEQKSGIMFQLYTLFVLRILTNTQRKSYKLFSLTFLVHLLTLNKGFWVLGLNRLKIGFTSCPIWFYVRGKWYKQKKNEESLLILYLWFLRSALKAMCRLTLKSRSIK